MTELEQVVEAVRSAGFVARISPWKKNSVAGGIKEVATEEDVLLAEHPFLLSLEPSGWTLRTTHAGLGELETHYATRTDAVDGLLRVLREKSRELQRPR